MNNILLILTIILVVITILLVVYLVVTFRKIHIVAKKIDYLVEDLTYKSEQLTPLVDSVVKVADFIDLFNSILKDRSQKVVKYTSNNQEAIYKIAKEVKNAAIKYKNTKVKNKHYEKKI